MKVLDLHCSQDHRFEGWFASEEDYVSQTERGLMVCPVCGDQAITRLPSAPRLNVSGARAPREDAGPAARTPARTGEAPDATPGPADPAARAVTLQALWMQAVRHVMANTVDVGDRFAEEARRIHYGEADDRAIRGRTTPQEAQSLRDEGIEVVALPVPEALKGPLQ